MSHPMEEAWARQREEARKCGEKKALRLAEEFIALVREAQGGEGGLVDLGYRIEALIRKAVL